MICLVILGAGLLHHNPGRLELARYTTCGCAAANTIAMLDRPSYYCRVSEKNKAAQELGRLGGLKGGKARAAKLTKEERSEIARKAAKARWAKKRQQEEEESP